MNLNRPLLNESAESLKNRFDSYRNDPIHLKAIADELEHRSTAKAQTLLAEVSPQGQEAAHDTLLAEVSAALSTALDGVAKHPREQKVVHDSKLINLIEYLNNLAQVTTATVLDLANYQNVLWLESVPRDPVVKCFSRHRGPDDNVAEDVWVDVIKMSEPHLPTGLKAIEQWVDESTLQNVDGIPALRETIVVTTSRTDPETGVQVNAIEEQRLNNHPEVNPTFDVWVEQKWRPWATIRRCWNEVQSLRCPIYHLPRAAAPWRAV